MEKYGLVAVTEVYSALEQEFDRLKFLAYQDEVLVGIVLSWVHLDNKFIAEANLAKVENRLKHVQGIFVKEIHKLRLCFGWQLLIKIKFFNDHVVVVA